MAQFPNAPWVGIMPGRLSFGIIGGLNEIDIGLERILIHIKNARFTDDILDKGKLGSCRISNIHQLIPEMDPQFLYMMAITNSGKLRTIWSMCVRLSSFGLAVQAIPTSKNVQVFDSFCITTAPGDRDAWLSFFFDGDNTWEQKEASFAKNSRTWTKNLSILKTTLCPPMC